MNEITVSAQFKLTPKELAQAFWSMDSTEQTGFLTALAEVIEHDYQTNFQAYSLGELQWFYVGDELKQEQNAKAREMLMTMAAPLYLHTLRHVDEQRRYV